MARTSPDPERSFEEQVATRYRLYSSLFLGLPFEHLEQVGGLLPAFVQHGRKGLRDGMCPREIVDRFFAETTWLGGADRTSTLFLFVQLIERQVVLFDALEEASFGRTHDLDGPGSVAHLLHLIDQEDSGSDFGRLLRDTATRIVLTAHPTQFYPDTVQGIIEDLRPALAAGDPGRVQRLLLQLGRTRFSNRERPTVLDEARAVLRIVEGVLYDVLPQIAERMLVAAYGRDAFVEHLPRQPNLQIGFWPGGDRDGNPHVTAAVTRKVAHLLRERVLARHLSVAQQLTRRLTFDGARERILEIVRHLHATWLAAAADDNAAGAGQTVKDPASGIYSTASELMDDLLELRTTVTRDHQRLFVEEIDAFITRVHLFGFWFASLDLRQHSGVFAATVRELVRLPAYSDWLGPDLARAATEGPSDAPLPIEVLERLIACHRSVSEEDLPALSELGRDTVETLRLVPIVQQQNGPLGLHRVVISHTHGPADVLAVLALAKLAGLEVFSGTLDIVPLFESIDALETAPAALAALLDSAMYRAVVESRGGTQTVMVGFSDGTKDGGFLAANWGIRQAKRRMTQVGRERNVRLVFFDGRGGPPARGGGNTHRFYRSRDLGIEQQQTHLTIQGQTISAQFGSFEAARYHVEQLLTPNLENLLFRGVDEDPPVEHHALMRDLAATAHEAYQTLRNHPDFLGFLERDSALPLFDYLTNASRPVSRHPSKGLELESLRAIPFVAAWTVQKMQILGFYGLGTALDRAITRGDGAKLRALYRDSRFFRALIGNAVMSLKKSRFDVSAHLARHPRYGSLWRGIRDEAERTERHILTISGKPQLLAEDPVTRRSIELREKLVLPLVLIVHDALARWNENRAAGTLESMEAQRARKLALKGIAAVINATRNAA